jgi:hypothetical protein
VAFSGHAAGGLGIRRDPASLQEERGRRAACRQHVEQRFGSIAAVMALVGMLGVEREMDRACGTIGSPRRLPSGVLSHC